MARFMNEYKNSSMKQLTYISVFFIVLVSAYSCTSGRYVSARPHGVVVTRPLAPGPGYIWIDGGYYWRGGGYRYRNGYWARPRGGQTWRSGNWVHSPRGYYWHRGGWHR